MPDWRFWPVESLVRLMVGSLFPICKLICIRKVHKLMGFKSQLQSESGTEGTFLEVKIVAPARSDGYLFTLMSWFSDHKTINAGLHR